MIYYDLFIYTAGDSNANWSVYRGSTYGLIGNSNAYFGEYNLRMYVEAPGGHGGYTHVNARFNLSVSGLSSITATVTTVVENNLCQIPFSPSLKNINKNFCLTLV